MIKIHYHSDCGFFAGCERMLVNFWADENLRREFDVSFSYRYSEKYKSGLDRNISTDFNVYPLCLGPVDPPLKRFAPPFGFLSKLIRAFYRMVIFPVYFIYEIFISYVLVKKIQPDIVHLNNGSYPGARSVRAFAVGARLAGCRSIIFVVNNFAKPFNSIDQWLESLVDRYVMRAVSMFITGSIATARHLESIKKMPHSKVRAINNATRQFNIEACPKEVKERLGLASGFSGFVIGVVSLMTERKGHKVLLDSIDILNNQFCDLNKRITVWFEGDGELKESLENYVQAKSLSHLVCFIGCESNIGDFINTIDVLVLPSIRDEDFPNVVLEAMSLGKAVVASKIAGIPEQIIDGMTGYLVEPCDPFALASALRKFILNPQLLDTMGKNGLHRYQERFTPEISVGRYIKLYKSLM